MAEGYLELWFARGGFKVFFLPSSLPATESRGRLAAVVVLRYVDTSILPRSSVQRPVSPLDVVPIHEVGYQDNAHSDSKRPLIADLEDFKLIDSYHS